VRPSAGEEGGEKRGSAGDEAVSVIDPFITFREEVVGVPQFPGWLAGDGWKAPLILVEETIVIFL